jgi:hypothetical protein
MSRLTIEFGGMVARVEGGRVVWRPESPSPSTAPHPAPATMPAAPKAESPRAERPAQEGFAW